MVRDLYRIATLRSVDGLVERPESSLPFRRQRYAPGRNIYVIAIDVGTQEPTTLEDGGDAGTSGTGKWVEYQCVRNGETPHEPLNETYGELTRMRSLFDML